jgi:regulator of protease activity HflC (stomatin/prohibitin superfamily)
VENLKVILLLAILWFMLPQEHEVDNEIEEPIVYSINPSITCVSRDGVFIEVEYTVGVILKDPEYSFEEFVCNYIYTIYSTELQLNQLKRSIRNFYSEYTLIDIRIIN